MEAAGPRRAAIDIGTVSTRLLVADVADGEVVTVIRETVVTHLGEGVAETGLLASEALERTLAQVREYRDAADAAGASEIRVVATSAARDAENGAEFTARLTDLGLQPQIISGAREAYLSFLGATYSLRDEGVLVVDLGGGSTELIVGSVIQDDEIADTRVAASRSLDVGSRRVTDLFLASDPPTEEESDTARAWVVDQARPFFDGLKERPCTMIALAGTATTVAAIQLGLTEYDAERVHGTVVTGGGLADVREHLASLTLDARRRVTGLDPARAEVIVGGVLVLEALLGLAGLDEFRVSEHDILFGLVLADD